MVRVKRLLLDYRRIKFGGLNQSEWDSDIAVLVTFGRLKLTV